MCIRDRKESEMPAEPMQEAAIYRETANYAYEAGELESYQMCIRDRPAWLPHRWGVISWA